MALFTENEGTGREFRVIASGVAQANTGQTTVVDTPAWANAACYHLSVGVVSGNTPLTDYIIIPQIPVKVGAAVVATTTAGDGTHNEVQTITLTGGPDFGTWQIVWTGISADVTATTKQLSPTESAAAVQTAINEALNGTIYGGGLQITVTRSGAGTSGSPYVYTLTWSGDRVNLRNVDAVTVTDLGLCIWTTDTNQTLDGWNGITQIAGTTSGNVQVWLSPPTAAVDDTAPEYRLGIAFLPTRLAHKITFDRTTGDETYTYALVAEYCRI